MVKKMIGNCTVSVGSEEYIIPSILKSILKELKQVSRMMVLNKQFNSQLIVSPFDKDTKVTTPSENIKNKENHVEG